MGRGENARCIAPYALAEDSLKQAITMLASARPQSQSGVIKRKNRDENILAIADDGSIDDSLLRKSGWVGVTRRARRGHNVNYTYRSYVSGITGTKHRRKFKYLKLNDYLLGAMSITDSVVGVFYPPRNYSHGRRL